MYYLPLEIINFIIYRNEINCRKLIEVSRRTLYSVKLTLLSDETRSIFIFIFNYLQDVHLLRM